MYAACLLWVSRGVCDLKSDNALYKSDNDGDGYDDDNYISFGGCGDDDWRHKHTYIHILTDSVATVHPYADVCPYCLEQAGIAGFEYLQ